MKNSKIKIIHSGEHKEKRLKKIYRVLGTCGRMTECLKFVSLESWKRENMNWCRKRIAENFPSLVKDIHFQIEEAHQT